VQRERSSATSMAVVVGFVVLSCVLGIVFMRYRDPEGWWTTLKEFVLGGDMTSGMGASTQPSVRWGIPENETSRLRFFFFLILKFEILQTAYARKGIRYFIILHISLSSPRINVVDAVRSGL
jgi:hypothetical protein